MQQEGLFDTTKEKMNLVLFVVDSLNSSASRGKKRATVLISNFYLQRHKTTSSSNTKLAQLISISTMSMTSLINILGWAASEDGGVWMFVTKVTCHFAPNLEMIGIPSIMQEVSALLDAEDEPMIQDISSPILKGNGRNTK